MRVDGFALIHLPPSHAANPERRLATTDIWGRRSPGRSHDVRLWRNGRLRWRRLPALVDPWMALTPDPPFCPMMLAGMELGASGAGSLAWALAPSLRTKLQRLHLSQALRCSTVPKMWTWSS